MPRKVIARDELSAWMTAHIRKVEGCEQVEVGGVIPLQEPDAEGVNWSESIVLTATGVPKEIYEPAIRKVLATARVQFNIKK